MCLFQPALSIGNVGQLAADLLVSSMGTERVGYLDDPHVLPCVGNDAYGPVPQGDLALPLEGFALLFICSVTAMNFHFFKLKILKMCHFFAAYDSPSNALTIIQQRSPVIKVSSEASFVLFMSLI